MVNWDRPDWGGHVHMDTHGSWLESEDKHSLSGPDKRQRSYPLVRLDAESDTTETGAAA